MDLAQQPERDRKVGETAQSEVECIDVVLDLCDGVSAFLVDRHDLSLDNIGERGLRAFYLAGPPADLDLLLRLQLLEGDTADYYGSVIEGLRTLGLEPAVHNGRQTPWRWTGRHRDILLVVDLLSADPEDRAPAPRPVADAAARDVGDPAVIRTLPLAHGDLVEIDRRVVHRTADAREGRIADFGFPIAGLGSWLALKGAAIELRPKTKDAYDVVWLLQQLEQEAVHELRESPLWASDRAAGAAEGIERCLNHFLTVEHIGCQQYAEHLTGSGPGRERLKRDGPRTRAGYVVV